MAVGLAGGNNLFNGEHAHILYGCTANVNSYLFYVIRRFYSATLFKMPLHAQLSYFTIMQVEPPRAVGKHTFRRTRLTKIHCHKAGAA